MCTIRSWQYGNGSWRYEAVLRTLEKGWERARIYEQGKSVREIRCGSDIVSEENECGSHIGIWYGSYIGSVTWFWVQRNSNGMEEYNKIGNTVTGLKSKLKKYFSEFVKIKKAKKKIGKTKKSRIRKCFFFVWRSNVGFNLGVTKDWSCYNLFSL